MRFIKRRELQIAAYTDGYDDGFCDTNHGAVAWKNHPNHMSIFRAYAAGFRNGVKDVVANREYCTR